jgi:ATP-binding cassette subfamily B protein
MREAGADIGSLLVDTIMGMRSVVALGAETRERRRFAAANAGFVQAMLRMQVTSFLAGAVPGTLLSASSAAVMLWGGYEIFNGRLTIGTLVAFMAYHQRLFAPIQACWPLLHAGANRVALARIFELIDTPAEVVEAPDAAPLPAIRNPSPLIASACRTAPTGAGGGRFHHSVGTSARCWGHRARANPPSRI